MITIVKSPNAHILPDNSYAFYYDEGSNSLISRPFPSPGACTSQYSLVIGESEQECQDYIENNNINDPWSWTGE